MAQKILPPEGGIDPPGRSDPEVEGRWKLLDRLPNEADRQGLRGWLALRMSLTWSLLLFSNHGCQVHSLTFSWFFVRPGCRTEGGDGTQLGKGDAVAGCSGLWTVRPNSSHRHVGWPYAPRYYLT